MSCECHSTIIAAPDDIIFREGDPSDCAYLIESGEVEVAVEKEGRSIVLARRGPGDIVGEMAIIDRAPRSATVKAVSHATLMTITPAQLRRRLDSVDPVVRMCLSILLDRFRATIAEIKQGDNGHSLVPKLANSFSTPVAGAATEKAVHEIRLERALREALRGEHFEVHYQPIVDLADSRIAGYEALVRWRHPDRGLIMPGVFIPTAEASGLIGPISDVVMRQAFERLHQLAGAGGARASGQRRVFMSINLSPRDFMEPDFLANFAATMARCCIDPRQVKLEITEALLMENPARAAAALTALKELGCSIAIDDFGTGYSSLSYLHKFPIDTLKIDRSFVHEFVDNASAYEIVTSILQLAEKLRLQVVAEGIETPEQARVLCELGCGLGQGYLFGRPARETPTDLMAAA